MVLWLNHFSFSHVTFCVRIHSASCAGSTHLLYVFPSSFPFPLPSISLQISVASPLQPDVDISLWSPSMRWTSSELLCHCCCACVCVDIAPSSPCLEWAQKTKPGTFFAPTNGSLSLSHVHCPFWWLISLSWPPSMPKPASLSIKVLHMINNKGRGKTEWLIYVPVTVAIQPWVLCLMSSFLLVFTKNSISHQREGFSIFCASTGSFVLVYYDYGKCQQLHRLRECI